MENVLKHWQSLTPIWQVLIRDGGILFFVLIVGLFLRSPITRTGQWLGVDHLLFIPWPPREGGERDIRPASSWIGLAGTLCFWLTGCWFVALLHDSRDFIALFQGAGINVVKLVGVFFMAGVPGVWCFHAIEGVFSHSAIRGRIDDLFPAAEDREEGFSRRLARTLGVLAFTFWALLILVGAGEIFGLTVVAVALRELWTLGLSLFAAGIAVTLGLWGYLSLTAVTPLSAQEAAGPERWRHQAILGLLFITTILAIQILTATTSFVLAMVVIGVLSMIVLPVRAHLLEIWAGFMMSLEHPQEAVIRGETMKIKRVGLMTSELEALAGPLILSNCEVLAGIRRPLKGVPPQ